MGRKEQRTVKESLRDNKNGSAVNCCFLHQINAVIARSEATWQSPGYSEMSEKRTNALTNRPELLGDCHDHLSGLVSQ